MLNIKTISQIPNGRYFSLTWTREVKTKKNSPRITKQVTAVVRTGINYTHTKYFSPSSNTNWVSNAKTIIPNKLISYSSKTGHRKYLILYGNNYHKTTYYINNTPVPKSSITQYLYSTELQDTTTPLFYLPLEYITSIHSS